MPTAAFHTLGCKLNQYETEAIREQFETNGYEIVPFSSKADIYVINTCTVTAKSDRSSRQAVYQALRRAPHARVVATGCSAHISPQSFARIPGVECVIGNHRKERVFDHVTGRKAKGPALNILGKTRTIDQSEWFNIAHFRNYSRAFIKIQDGCDSACSYCVVPFARGSHRSRPIQSILSQARRLIDSGYREIVLTGVHIGAYGADLSGRCSLVDVLNGLIEMEGLWRLRLSSIEPMECSFELIDLIASSPKICRHVHIPLQSGDDDVLKRMRRNYSARDYGYVIERLVSQIPDIGIGTDVMVGFPGETEEHFKSSYEFIKDLPFSYLHVFSYSKRPGTPAADYPDQIKAEIKKNRSATLRQLRTEKIAQFQDRFIGRALEVLLERRRDKTTGMLTGLSDNYIRLMVDGADDLQGRPVEVVMEKSENGRAFGSISNLI